MRPPRELEAELEGVDFQLREGGGRITILIGGCPAGFYQAGHGRLKGRDLRNCVANIRRAKKIMQGS